MEQSRKWLACFQTPNSCLNPDKPYIGTYTVKLTRAKLPANAGNFTHGLHVKKAPHAVYMRYMQFTCENRYFYPRLRGKHLVQNIRELPAAACKFT